MDVTGLPEGYASRPHVRADAAAVCALVAEAEAHDDGVAEIDLSDIEADWRRPGFDLQTMSLGVFRGGELAASADVFAGRAEVSVKPGDRGRGIGTAYSPEKHASQNPAPTAPVASMSLSRPM